MRHGWRVIRREQCPTPDRIIAAAAFCSLIAIMLNAVFFFPFQISSTLFMTVLMLGLLEGLYVSHSGLLNSRPGWPHAAGRALIPVLLLVLVGWVWNVSIKPLKSEIEHGKYKIALGQGNHQQAIEHLLAALEYDPRNTAYCMYATQLYMYSLGNFPEANRFIERAIIDYNGDITRWTLFFLKGLLKFQSGSLFEAQKAFKDTIYLNPEFEPAHEKLKEVNQVIKDHDRVMIKFR